MDTYLYDIEYLVKDKEEVSKMEKILEELPIELPFHTAMVLEPNRLPREHFPYEITIYLDKNLERLDFEDYDELRQEYDSGESIDLLVKANKIDERVLLREVKPTKESCKITSASSEDGFEGLLVAYGEKDSLTKVLLAFWEPAYSGFP